MKPILGRWDESIYALLRIISGAMFMMHGTQKILGWPPSDRPAPSLTSLGGIGGLLELILGALILVGLLTSIAAFIASGEMAVAYFIAHFGPGLKFFPLMNRGESAVLYCFVFLYIAARGAGVWSIDRAMRRS